MQTALTAGAAAVLIGCRAPAGPVAQGPTEFQEAGLSTPLWPAVDGERRGDPIVIVQMQFDVLRVELPAGQFHHAEKTWNHVDELRQGPARAALMRRNGLRMGVASAQDWPALRALFEACDARVIQATHAVQRGLPLTLELDAITEDQTVFLRTADNRMVGATFDRGHKYLHLDYALNPEDGSTTVIVTPEIHRTSESKSWREREGQLQRVPDYEGKVFNELSGTVRLRPDEFLVIGPDAPGGNALSVGRHFLTRKHQGRTYETILCITPQPFRTEGGES